MVIVSNWHITNNERIKGMEYYKIIEGYVVQHFKDGKCTEQRFNANSVKYIDKHGKYLPLGETIEDEYSHYEIVTPEKE